MFRDICSAVGLPERCKCLKHGALSVGTGHALYIGMTKQDFDTETKQNWGSKCMASDERCAYRNSRHLEHNGSGSDAPTVTKLDLILRRGREMRRRNATHRDGTIINRDGLLPTLGIGSKWRNVAAYRRDAGTPLLG